LTRAEHKNEQRFLEGRFFADVSRLPAVIVPIPEADRHIVGASR
jgi:hypothetical protein